MSQVDKHALRKAAKKATQGEWVAFISHGKYGTYAVHTPKDDRCGDIINWPGFDGRENAAANARYIAAANPPTMLALLDENEALEKRVAELEAREVTTSLPGGFSVEEARCLQADLVRGHISKALSGEKMNPAVKAANLRWIHDVLVRAAWFVKASIESAAGASKGE